MKCVPSSIAALTHVIDLFPKKFLVFLVAFLCFDYFCGKLKNNNLITTL